ncbi:MAG: hypothetical protein ACHQVS_04210 [Candidatus Babeliales bacterium]
MQKPTIAVRFIDDNTTYYLSSNFIWEWPLFHTFDKEFLNQHQLPSTHIPYRNEPTQSVEGKTLHTLLEELVREVQAGKKVFTHFTVLGDRTSCTKLRAGSLILTCNKYPFVIKLFIENPEIFVKPLKKGGFQGFASFIIQLVCGGINRHLAGFTRIKNLLTIKALIAQNPKWAERIDLPRKWFWTPSNSKGLIITGNNFESKNLCITIPSIYCIIADAIESEKIMHWSHANDRASLKKMALTAFDFCKDIDFRIDVNPNNFIIERNTKKIVVIDTEHLPTLAGITRRPKNISGLVSFAWFLLKNSALNLIYGPLEKMGNPFDSQ